MPEAEIEVFQLGGPAALDRHLGPDTRCPSLVEVNNLVHVVCRPRALEKAAEGPRNPASRVDHPLRERIAETATDGGDLIDFLCAIDIDPCAGPSDIVCGKIVQERCVGFNSQQKARGQEVIVSDLEATGQTAEWAAEIVHARVRAWIIEGDVGMTTGIADMAAKIVAGPNPWGRRGGGLCSPARFAHTGLVVRSV